MPPGGGDDSLDAGTGEGIVDVGQPVAVGTRQVPDAIEHVITELDGKAHLGQEVHPARHGFPGGRAGGGRCHSAGARLPGIRAGNPTSPASSGGMNVPPATYHGGDERVAA